MPSVSPPRVSRYDDPDPAEQVGNALVQPSKRARVEEMVPASPHSSRLRRAVRHRTALAALVLAALGALLYVRYGRPSLVETVRVERGELVRTVVTSGQVEAPRRTQLASEVGGRVVSVQVEEGQRVERDALLVQIDDANARAAVDEATAAVNEAEARLSRLRRTGVRVALATEARAQADAESARDNFQRTETLVNAGVLPSAQLEEARRQRDASAAQLRLAEAEAESASAGGSDLRLTVAALRRTQAALRSAQRRLEQTALRAPAAGTVLRRTVELGEVVQAGQSLFEFVADGAPRLEVHPDESHLAFIRQGQPALASVEAHPNDIFPATVDRIAPSVDAARGTVKVELTINEPVPEFLLPGMTASVEIELARLADVLIVPGEALENQGSDQASVLVIGTDGRLQRRAVRVGLRAGELLEIQEGLEAGERVVVGAGDEGPDAGDRVRVAEGS